MKLTAKKLKQIIKEELEEVAEGLSASDTAYILQGQGDYGPGGPSDDDIARHMGKAPDKDEDPNAPDEKPFVLHFLKLLVNGATGQPLTPEEIAAMDPRAIGDLASQMRQALRGKGAKRIPPLSDPGAFDPFDGQ